MPTPYFARNPNLLRTRGSYDSLRGASNEVNVVWPVRPNPGVNRGYQTGILRPDGRLASYTAVSLADGLSRRSPSRELRGNVFVVDPAANVVSRIIIQDDGTKLVARKAYEQAEFLTSTDERFRPVYLSNAPDGTLYLVDMYHGIIQHRDYITEYLRDQILSRKLEGPSGHGRIYRDRPRDDAAAIDAGSRRSRDAGAAGRAACRTRTAGGATRRSGCSSNAAI